MYALRNTGRGESTVGKVFLTRGSRSLLIKMTFRSLPIKMALPHDFPSSSCTSAPHHDRLIHTAITKAIDELEHDLQRVAAARSFCFIFGVAQRDAQTTPPLTGKRRSGKSTCPPSASVAVPPDSETQMSPQAWSQVLSSSSSASIEIRIHARQQAAASNGAGSVGLGSSTTHTV